MDTIKTYKEFLFEKIINDEDYRNYLKNEKDTCVTFSDYERLKNKKFDKNNIFSFNKFSYGKRKI
jgi:hypothetical protein